MARLPNIVRSPQSPTDHQVPLNNILWEGRHMFVTYGLMPATEKEAMDGPSFWMRKHKIYFPGCILAKCPEKHT